MVINHQCSNANFASLPQTAAMKTNRVYKSRSTRTRLLLQRAPSECRSATRRKCII